MSAHSGQRGSERTVPQVSAARHSSVLTLVLLLLIVGTTVAAGVGIFSGSGPNLTPIILTTVAVSAIGYSIAVGTRFWPALLILLALRASLDVLKTGPAGGVLEPATAVGAVFIGSAILWLVAQRAAGCLSPVSRTGKALLLLTLACFVSATAARDPLVSIQAGAKVLSGALMFVVLEQLFKQGYDRRKLVAAILASLAVPAAVALLQALGADPANNLIGVSRVQGTFAHPNPFAAYLVLLLLMALALLRHVQVWQRRGLYGVLLVTGGLLVVTYARGAWAGAIVGIIVLGLLQSRRLLFGLVVGTLLIVVFVPSVMTRLSDLDGGYEGYQAGLGDPNSLAWRFGYWDRLIPLADDNPITGIGLEMVAVSSPEGLQPHNVFVQSYVETGLFGLGALLVLITCIALDLRAATRSADPGLGRGLAVGAVAVSTSFLLQLISENLLSQGANLWYLSAVLACAIATLTSRTPAWDPPPPRLEEAPASAVAVARGDVVPSIGGARRSMSAPSDRRDRF